METRLNHRLQVIMFFKEGFLKKVNPTVFENV